MRSLTGQLRGKAKSIIAKKTYSKVEKIIAKVAIFAYQGTEAPINISVDTSDSTIGIVLY